MSGRPVPRRLFRTKKDHLAYLRHLKKSADVERFFPSKSAAKAYQHKVQKAGRVATPPYKVKGGYLVRSTRIKVFLNLGADEHLSRSARHESRSRRLAASSLRKSGAESLVDYSNMMYESGKAAAHKESVTGKNAGRRGQARVYWLTRDGKGVVVCPTKKEAERLKKEHARYSPQHKWGVRLAKNPKRPCRKGKKIKRNRGKRLTDKDMQELMRDPEFKKALKLYRKLHGCDPESISRRILPIGGKRVTGREFFVSMGKAPAESYEPYQKGSRKKGTIWVHPYSNKPEKVVSADGKTIITLPGTHGVRDIDGEAWIDG